MKLIELTDDQAAALNAKASEEGLTLEAWLNKDAWLKKLASEGSPGDRPLQTAAEIVLARMRNVPAEAMAALPTDGASQHDHYIYGSPKKER